MLRLFPAFLLVALIFAFLVAADLALAARTMSKQTGSAPPLTHPISTAPPMSDGPTPNTMWGGFNPAEPTLPLSKAQETADGATLYSRDVNRFYCVAEEKRGGKIWLGTPLGIKRVDPAAGVVRHYGARENLPAGRVAALAADADGAAWCVIEGPPGDGQGVVFHFCAFQPDRERWKTLYSVALPPPAPVYLDSYGGYDAVRATRPLIVSGPSSVVFTLGSVNPADNSAAYLWHRRKAALQKIPWEPGLRADNAALVVTFAGLEPKNSVLWLGTNIGLLRCILSGDNLSGDNLTGKRTWRRDLPDQIIQTGTMAEKSGEIWFLSTPRPANRGAATPTSPDAWKLYRAKASNDTKSGGADIQEMTPGVKIPPKPEQPPMPYSGVAAANNSVPISVSRADDGAIWLTQMGSGGFNFYDDARREAWWRRDPKTAAWTRYELGRDAVPFMPGSAPTLRQTPPSGPPYHNVALSEIADAAVRPLALHRAEFSGGSYTVTPSGGYSAEDARTGFWVRRRFPNWLCPDDAPAEISPLVAGNLAWNGITGPVPDPAGPTGTIWIADMTGGLLRLPESAIPESYRQARLNGYYPPSVMDSADGPNVEKFSPPAGGALQFRPNVEAVVAAGRDGDRLYVIAQGFQLLSFDTQSGVFTRIPLPRDGIFPSRDNPPVATDTGDLILSSPNASDSTVLRYDAKEGTFRVLATPGFAAKAVGIAPNGGLWIVENGGRLVYQAPGAAESVPVPGAINAGNPGSVAVTGYTGWTRADDGDIHGYDAERKRETPPLKLFRKGGNSGNRGIPILPDGSGGAFAASEDDAAVYRYDRERNAWEIAAPSLPKLPEDSSGIHLAPLLAAADEREIWILADARFLCRYDRRAKTWDAPIPLPDALRGGNSSENALTVAAAGKGNAIFVGGQSGLWRFDRNDRRWSDPLTLTVPVPSPGNSKFGSNNSALLAALTVNRESVFTVWRFNLGGATFAARFDRKTAQWTFYDESKGFPSRDSSPSLMAAGDGPGVWLRDETGTYFFDAKRDRWQLAFGQPDKRPSQIGERVPPAALPSRVPDDVRVADIVSDPATGDSFVLANPSQYVAGAAPTLYRCNREGQVIARSVPPKGEQFAASQGYSLLLDAGTIFVATSAGVYRLPLATFPASGATWNRLPPPPGLTPFRSLRLKRPANGRGLYVLDNDNAAYWPL